MTRSSSFSPAPPGVRSSRTASGSSQGVGDFLRGNDKLAALLPGVQRIVALQRDCKTILPLVFESCSVVRFESGELVLAAPSAAFVAKLKQQLPKLQSSLQQLGWQVNSIRLKVQVGKPAEKPLNPKQIALSQQALTAFAELNNALDDSPQNAALKAALGSLLNRHRKKT